MRLDPSAARQRFSAGRVAHLTTVTDAGAPHVVPICFVVVNDTLYSAVDDKPKSSTALRRLANITAHPHAAVLVDHYDDDDWTRLWWARADGSARVVDDDGERSLAVARLREKYPQYRTHRLTGAVLAVDVSRWTGWTWA